MLASLWHPTEFAALVQWKLTKVGESRVNMAVDRCADELFAGSRRDSR